MAQTALPPTDTRPSSFVGRIADIPLPQEFQRLAPPLDSYATYLQNLPLKKDTLIYLHNGQRKPDQSFGWAVLDIDVGPRNLQQCADAAIRLRAEYLFAQQRFEEIHFNFTSGDTAHYLHWREGYRALLQGNRVQWVKKADYDASYKNFRAYLDLVFNYAGSWSLEKELRAVPSLEEISIGDMLVRGAFPGHVMVVVDMARHLETGEIIFLLAQSARPAQDIHIVRNRVNPKYSPWYSLNDLKPQIQIEEWTFYPESLKRF
ncbi:MAG: DUF4846 domain-containing protein [Microscillaceae bacterium]